MKETRINVTDFRANLSEVLDAVKPGWPLVITRGNLPVVAVVKCDGNGKIIDRKEGSK